MIRYAGLCAQFAKDSKKSTDEELADLCGLSRRTLIRWRKIKEFQEWFEDKQFVEMATEREYISKQSKRYIEQLNDRTILIMEGIRVKHWDSDTLSQAEGFEFILKGSKD